MVPLNISPEKGENLASIIGYKLSKLFITYLGIPLHFKKLQAEH
jgi:hypothetical protein